jgi:hypothetical protein
VTRPAKPGGPFFDLSISRIDHANEDGRSKGRARL